MKAVFEADSENIRQTIVLYPCWAAMYPARKLADHIIIRLFHAPEADGLTSLLSNPLH